SALAAFRRAGDLVLSYQGPVDQQTLNLMAELANWLTKFEDTGRALPLFDRARQPAAGMRNAQREDPGNRRAADAAARRAGAGAPDAGGGASSRAVRRAA